MSYASVSSITHSVMPAFDVRATRRAGRRGASVGVFGLQSLGLAAVLWLLLAGPALLSGGADMGRATIAAQQ